MNSLINSSRSWNRKTVNSVLLQASSRFYSPLCKEIKQNRLQRLLRKRHIYLSARSPSSGSFQGISLTPSHQENADSIHPNRFPSASFNSPHDDAYHNMNAGDPSRMNIAAPNETLEIVQEEEIKDGMFYDFETFQSVFPASQDTENFSLRKETNEVDAKKVKQRCFFEELFENPSAVFCNYLQVCLYSGLFSHALNLLEERISSVLQPSSHSMSPSRTACDPQVYDIVLSRLASISPKTSINSNLLPNQKQATPIDLIRKIFSVMHNVKVKPTPSAYAAALEALDKLPEQNVVLQLCLQQIEGDGYSLNDIVRSCFPGSKSAKRVRRSIQRIKELDEDPYQETLEAETEPEEIPHLVKSAYDRKPAPGAVRLSFPQDINKQYSKQVKLEKQGLLEVTNILRVTEDSDEVILKKQQLACLLEEWRESLLKTFQEAKKKEKAKHADASSGQHQIGSGGKVYPFLCLLPERDYVEIIINHLCQTITGGNFTITVSEMLGDEVYARFTKNRMKETGIMLKLSEVYKKYFDVYTDQEKQASHQQLRHFWQELEKDHGLTNLEEKVLPWSNFWKHLVGMKLIEVMNTVTFVPQRYWRRDGLVRSRDSKHRVPAIFNSYIVRGRRQVGMTTPHPEFQNLLRDALDKLVFESEVAPMLVPPRPWRSTTQGGFLINQAEFMRCKHYDEGEGDDLEPFQLLDGTKLGAIYDSLNILGSVAWVINKPILDLQIKYFRNRGNKDLSIPQPATEGQAMPSFSDVDEDDMEELERLRMCAVEVQKTRNEMHCLFMEALYKLSVAHEFRDEVFWFPHNIDFRGRCYPIARHFNYMGSDVYRSLFLFAEGRPLGPGGLDWLKIHCINLTDFKKHSSIEDRLAYANEILDDIVSSADHPDAKGAMWKTSDKPWQTLAACMEIAAAIRSPDPEKFISHLPVHQDGSCNGLQHYAAMGRDVLGAYQVNLSPSVTPQDVYLGVAAKAEELRRKDAEMGNPVAKCLEGFVRRKVVKQTVMTTVYGVTRYGGMRQIRRQLGYLDDEFPITESGRGANYLVDKVFKSVTEMFSGARNIQTWLIQLADVISKLGQPVDWVTPLNLLVTQPYFKPKKTPRFISSPVQRLTILENDLAVPNSRKQKNGFPPNFVHSLDSTHMMLTSLHCYNRGICFASVHDCFWTHACSIDEMNTICRDQFVALHSEPILQNVAAHMRKHLSDGTTKPTKHHQRLKELLNNVPEVGDFDLNEVKKSTFFFS